MTIASSKTVLLNPPISKTLNSWIADLNRVT